MTRPLILLFGNCQFRELGELLVTLDPVRENYETVWVRNWGELRGPWERVSECRLLITQSTMAPIPMPFEAELPRKFAHIKLPLLTGEIFWPHVTDSKDAIFDNVVKRSNDLSSIIQAYKDFDVVNTFSLDRFHQTYCSKLRWLDEHSDVKISDFILSNLQSRRLFHCRRHSTHELFVEISKRVLRLLDMDLSEAHEKAYMARPILGGFQVPVHPKIIDHFNLSWVSKDERYSMILEGETERHLTLEEYLTYKFEQRKQGEVQAACAK